jgi:hypothetical protein
MGNRAEKMIITLLGLNINVEFVSPLIVKFGAFFVEEFLNFFKGYFGSCFLDSPNAVS